MEENTKDDPYVKSGAEYDRIVGYLLKRIRNWQLFAYLLVVVLVLLAIAQVIQAKKSFVVPYIVEVDQFGRAAVIGMAKEYKINDEKIIKAFLFRYIDSARTILPDPIALKENLDLVYNSSVGSVQSNFLNPWYREHDPYVYAEEKGTRHVEPLVFLKQAENTYLIEWKEIGRNYDQQVTGETRHKALITIIQIPPTNKDMLEENPYNPFGLYVTTLSWSELQ